MGNGKLTRILFNPNFSGLSLFHILVLSLCLSSHTYFFHPKTFKDYLRKCHLVKSVRIRRYSSPYSVRIREILTKITPNTDSFLRRV